jgi:hypothetical protein
MWISSAIGNGMGIKVIIAPYLVGVRIEYENTYEQAFYVPLIAAHLLQCLEQFAYELTDPGLYTLNNTQDS